MLKKNGFYVMWAQEISELFGREADSEAALRLVQKFFCTLYTKDLEVVIVKFRELKLIIERVGFNFSSL